MINIKSACGARRSMRLSVLMLLPLFVLQETPTFAVVQPELFGAGANFTNAWADFDGDGDLDLFVGFNGTPNRLYRNDKRTFVDVAATAGVADARATRSVAWGDFDGDGDSDLLVGFTPGAQSLLKLYQNTSGKFIDVTNAVGIARDSGAVRQPSFVDYDGDGDLDLFVAFRDRPNMLFRNTNGHFVDVAAELGVADKRKTVGAVWFDYDEDGDLDLYVSNMDGDANGLFRNDGTTFTDVAVAQGVAWGNRKPNDPTAGTVRPCIADVDGDGHLDIATANYGPNGLFLNRGGGRFENASQQWHFDVESHYDACAFADFDNDGKLDFYVNGTVAGTTSYRDYLYRQENGAMVDVTPENIKALQADHGVQWADYDNDGDMDLALTGSRADGMHSLLRNDLKSSNKSLAVRVVDLKGIAARAGAEIRVRNSKTGVLIGTRHIDTGSGYDAQNDMAAHFGLGTVDVVDVEVIYPANGRRLRAEQRNVRVVQYKGKALVMKVANGPGPAPKPSTRVSLLLDPSSPEWTKPAPAVSHLRFETSKGVFVLELVRANGPIGADRLYNLARLGFYNDTRFHRVNKDYIAQFGLNGNSEVNRAWRDQYLRDDAPKSENVRGSFAFAMKGVKDTRNTQIFINLANNTRSDAEAFTMLGTVIEGMNVVDSLYSGYGENSGSGVRQGRQGPLATGGNAYMDREFPQLDRIKRVIVSESVKP